MDFFNEETDYGLEIKCLKCKAPTSKYVFIQIENDLGKRVTCQTKNLCTNCHNEYQGCSHSNGFKIVRHETLFEQITFKMCKNCINDYVIPSNQNELKSFFN